MTILYIHKTTVVNIFLMWNMVQREKKELIHVNFEIVEGILVKCTVC